MEVREATSNDAAWISGRLIESWGSTRIVLRGELVETMGCPTLIAGEGEGLLQFRLLREGVGEIVTLEAFTQRRGIGTALLEAYVERAQTTGLGEIVVITTNDNLNALRFYQRRGFVIKEVRVNALEEARKLKPEIPPLGNDGIPLRDEIELSRML